MEGFIKLHRKIQNWEWSKNPNTWGLFIHLIVLANWQDKQWQGVTVKRGQLATSRRSLSEKTGLSEQQIRTALANLSRTHDITIESTSKHSLITITNYNSYQEWQSDSNQQFNPQVNPPTNQPTNQQSTSQLTTTKEYKNNKNIRREEERKEEGFPSDSPISEEEKRSYYAGDNGEEFDFSDKDFDLPYKPPEIYCMEDHFENCTSSWIKTIADGMSELHPDSVKKLAHRTTEEWMDGDNWQEFQEIVQPFIGYPWKRDVEAQNKRDEKQKVSEVKSA